MKTKTVSATEIKNRFGDYLGEVIHGGEPVLVERHGRPVAVLISYKNWIKKEIGTERENPWFAAYSDLMEKIRRESPSPLKTSAVELVRMVREEEDS